MAEEKAIPSEIVTEKTPVRLFGIALVLMFLRTAWWVVQIAAAFLTDDWEIEIRDDPVIWIETFVICLIFIIILYLLIIMYICKTQWVKVEWRIEVCWLKCSWKRPWGCIWTIYCVIVECVRWILRIFCRKIWVRILIVLLVFTTCYLIHIIHVV